MREQHAKQIMWAAIEAVQPAALISNWVVLENEQLKIGDHIFDCTGSGKIVVIGAGKASAQMATALEGILGNRIHRGVVVTKYGHQLPLSKIECIEAGHPVPDSNGVRASKKMIECLQHLNAGDLVICLISGGASALLTDHPPGSTLEDVQLVSKLLLSCGADITEINTIRKHLSSIKGGQLARLTQPATTVSLILSDVIGDPLDVIASGPTVPDPSTFQDAWALLDKYSLIDQLPPSINKWLFAGLQGQIRDTPKSGDAVFDHVQNYIVGSNLLALKAAREKAVALGYHTSILCDNLSGEARDQGALFVQTCMNYHSPVPACLLMGGETTVTLRGNGLGGRNQEFVLAALAELKRMNPDASRVPLILSAGTDGSDGPTDATGAFIDREVFSSKELPDIDAHLNKNDAYNFFKQTGTLLITGPTQTNVMDIVIGIIE